MPFKLSRPLVCLDVESTGTLVKMDRVVEIALVTVQPSGEIDEWQTYINPTIPIPAEATAIHHITDEAVANAPRFADIALPLSQKLTGVDIAGYNHVSYDVPLLKEEFKRCGIDGVKVFAGAKHVDAFKLFQRLEPRTLSTAVKYFCGEDFNDAHSALEDVRATLRVLEAQLDFPKVPNTPDEIHSMLFDEVREGFLDAEGKIALRNGVAVVNFGKYAGTPIRQLDAGFMRWCLRQDFSERVKEVFTEELKRRG